MVASRIKIAGMPANWAMRTPMNHGVMRSLHTRDLRTELRKPRVHLGFEALDALAKLSQTAIVVGHSDRRIAGRCLIGTSFDERLVQFDNHGCHGMSAPDARCWTGSCRHCRAPAAALSPLASRSIFGVSATRRQGQRSAMRRVRNRLRSTSSPPTPHVRRRTRKAALVRRLRSAISNREYLLVVQAPLAEWYRAEDAAAFEGL